MITWRGKPLELFLDKFYSRQDIKQQADNSAKSIVIESSKGVCKETKHNRDGCFVLSGGDGCKAFVFGQLSEQGDKDD